MNEGRVGISHLPNEKNNFNVYLTEVIHIASVFILSASHLIILCPRFLKNFGKILSAFIIFHFTKQYIFVIILIVVGDISSAGRAVDS